MHATQVIFRHGQWTIIHDFTNKRFHVIRRDSLGQRWNFDHAHDAIEWVEFLATDDARRKLTGRFDW